MSPSPGGIAEKTQSEGCHDVRGFDLCVHVCLGDHQRERLPLRGLWGKIERQEKKAVEVVILIDGVSTTKCCLRTP